MILRVTINDIKEEISPDYCFYSNYGHTQNFLAIHQDARKIAYNSGTMGWNFSVYEFEICGYYCYLIEGYRPYQYGTKVKNSLDLELKLHRKFENYKRPLKAYKSRLNPNL